MGAALHLALLALLSACKDGSPQETAAPIDADGDGYPAEEDCDDSDPQIHPGQTEVCNGGVDDDCDGLADDADPDVSIQAGVTWWPDGDGDGFGAGPAQLSCVLPSGGLYDDTDCDDTNAASYPGAPEICDGQDNNCQGSIDEGLLGQGPLCAAKTCLTLSESGESTSGTYWIDPSASDPFLAYCDLVSDGGGWTLLSWTFDGAWPSDIRIWQSEPYPGLDICETLDCSAGSAGTADRMQALIQASTSFGSGMSTSTLDTFQTLEAYEYASAFDYGDLSATTLSIDTYNECQVSGAIEGVNRVLQGPRDYDGQAVWLSPELRCMDDQHSEGRNYMWSYASSSPCSSSSTMPGVYLNNWTPSSTGPYPVNQTRARSSWLR